jgi:hypothetical protein
MSLFWKDYEISEILKHISQKIPHPVQAREPLKVKNFEIGGSQKT